MRNDVPVWLEPYWISDTRKEGPALEQMQAAVRRITVAQRIDSGGKEGKEECDGNFDHLTLVYVVPLDRERFTANLVMISLVARSAKASL